MTHSIACPICDAEITAVASRSTWRELARHIHFDHRNYEVIQDYHDRAGHHWACFCGRARATVVDTGEHVEIIGEHLRVCDDLDSHVALRMLARV